MRVIRGFKGKSIYAPAEGYRYDGLYTVEKVSITSIYETDATHKWFRRHGKKKVSILVDILSVNMYSRWV